MVSIYRCPLAACLTVLIWHTLTTCCVCHTGTDVAPTLMEVFARGEYPG